MPYQGVGIEIDSRGDRAVGGGSIAKLPVVISSPAIGGGIGETSAGVRFSSGELRDVGQAAHCHGGAALVGGVVAELAVSIEAPTACGAIGKIGAGVSHSSGDL